MNVPINTVSSKVAQSTAPVAKGTMSFTNSGTPSIGSQLKDLTSTQRNINQNNQTYKSLQRQGKSYGSGFGG